MKITTKFSVYSLVIFSFIRSKILYLIWIQISLVEQKQKQARDIYLGMELISKYNKDNWTCSS